MLWYKIIIFSYLFVGKYNVLTIKTNIIQLTSNKSCRKINVF